MSDDEAQQDEMLAMESIFDSSTFLLHPSSGDVVRSGQIKIRLDLPDPFYVTVETPTPSETETGDGSTNKAKVPGQNEEGTDPETGAKYKVQFLPPLVLHFTLPKDYPSKARPNFTLSCVWLHRASLSILCHKLDDLWEENKGMGILFTWANYLQTETLSDLGIKDHYDVAWHARPQYLGGGAKVSTSSKGNPSKRRSSVSIDLDKGQGQAKRASLIEEKTKSDLEPGPSPKDEVKVKPETGTSASSSANGHAARGRKRKCRKSKSRKAKVTVNVDPRAASDSIPRREDGKEVGLLDHILSFNEDQIRETFLQSSHSCDICFSMKSGRSCCRFRCGHVFCEECVSGFFTTNITEGNVDQVKCLAFNCKMRPSPEMVKQLVGEEMYERYDQILLKRALENMSDIIYCPRPKCHNPVICDPNEKCAFCTACGYTFCSICKMVYHGVEPCRFKNANMQEVFEKFTKGTADEKRELMRAYGEKQLKVLVENVLSEKWIQQESKPCPHCKVPIEKFEGCNKVTCFKCNAYFCWLCLKQLEQGNPYFHFNDPSSKCYNNLFQDVAADDAGPVNGWFVVNRGGDDDSEDDDDDDDEDMDDSDFDYFDEDFDDDFGYY